MRWYRGRVYLDRAFARPAKAVVAAMVWPTVRALEDGRDGRAATTAEIAEMTGYDARVTRRAVADLIGIGMLKRDGKKISTPSYAKEQ